VSKDEDRWKNLDREYRILTGIQPRKLGPTPIFFDRDGAVLCYEFVEGAPLEPLQVKNHLAAIARKAREIHDFDVRNFSIPFNQYPNFYGFMEEIERYSIMRLAEAQKILDKKYLNMLQQILMRARDRLHKNKKYFKGTDLRFSHKDFKSWNLVLQESGEIMPIDWNFGNICDPAFDLCQISRSSDLNIAEVDELIRYYGQEDTNLRARIDTYMDICRVPCIIWHVDRLKNPLYNISEKRKEEYRRYSGRYLIEMIKEGNAPQGALRLIS